MLRKGLQEAVRFQAELAGRSPHVLEFRGGLEEDDGCFFVEHEPAEPVVPATLFDPRAPGADESSLLAAAVGLADAIRAAQTTNDPRHAVHGGICPGVVLTGSTGIIKLTDFGFAPLICRTLGVESYIELAVGPDDSPPSSHRTTGCWQVLGTEDDTRDDRLCGFVDPYKYGKSELHTFEPASDIVAIGIFLHVFAEHRHPMLGGGEDHRLVYTSESMAYLPYDGARRKELRESTNPAVRLWCDLITKMLSHEPKDRPTIPQILDSFAKFDVRPADATERFDRLLGEARKLADAGRWQEVKDKIELLLANPGTPAPIVEQAKELQERARLYLLIREAERLASTDDWRLASKPIDELPKTGLSADVIAARDKVRDKLRGLRYIEDELTAVETTAADLTVSDTGTSLEAVKSLIQRVETAAGQSPIPSQQRRCSEILQGLIRRRDELESRFGEIIRAFGEVRTWFKLLQKAWKDEDWPAFEECLQRRPTTPHWPNDVGKRPEKLEEDYRIVQTALAWIARVPQPPPDDEKLLESLLAQRPELHGNPPKLSRNVEQVAARLRDVLDRLADFRRAGEWIAGVSQAVDAKKWREASKSIDAPPTIAHWPPEVAKQKDRLLKEIDQHVKDEERRELAVNRWLRDAKNAADSGEFEQAIALLHVAPEAAKPLDPDDLTKAEEKKGHYRRQLDAFLARRDEIAKAEVKVIVREFLGKDLHDLIDAGLVEARLEGISWDSNKLESKGKARVQVDLPASLGPFGKPQSTYALERAGEPPLPQGGEGFTHTLLELHFEADRVTVVNVDALRAHLTSTIAESLKHAQQTWIAEVCRPLQEGLFPKAGISAPLDRPVPRAKANIHLLGNDVPAEIQGVELAWEPRALQWTIVGVEQFHRRLCEFVVTSVQPLVKPLLLKQSPLLARYESALSVTLLPPDRPFDPASKPLRLEGRVDIALNEQAGHRDSVTFPISCPTAGQVVVEPDPRPIEDALNKVIAAVQESARTALERKLLAVVEAATNEVEQASPAKIEVVVHTKSIKRPVERVDFSLCLKRGRITKVLAYVRRFSTGTDDPTDQSTRELSAPWNEETLQFDLPGNLRDIIQELLLRHKRPEPPPEPEGEPPRKMVGVFEWVRRGAVLFGVILVVLAVGVGIWQLMKNRGYANAQTTTTKELSVDDGEQPPPPPPPPLPPNWERICANRRNEVQDVLREAHLPDKTSFDQHADLLVGCRPDDGTDKWSLCYTIPGLRKTTGQDVRFMRCVPVDDGFKDKLPDDFKNEVKEEFGTLDGLLSDPASKLEGVRIEVEKAVKNQLVTDLIDPQLVMIERPQSQNPAWTLDETATIWRTDWFSIQARIKVSGISVEAPQNDQRVRFIVVDGDQKTESGDFTELAVRLANAVNTQVEQLLDDGQKKLEQSFPAGSGDGWNIAKATNSTKTEPAWTLTPPRLLERRLQASWNASKLSFDTGEWTNTVEEIDRLTTRLAEIDRQIAAPDHWIRKPWKDKPPPQFEEAVIPKDATWRLKVRAPWPGNPGQPDILYIDAGIERNKETFEPPFYWPMLERYTELTDKPQPLSPEDVQSIDYSKLAEDDKKLLQDLLNERNSLKLFEPRLTLDTDSADGSAPNVEWSCNPDPPKSASLAVKAKINLDRRPDGSIPPEVDKDKLDKSLPTYPCRVEFHLNPGQAAPQTQRIQITKSPSDGPDISTIKEFETIKAFEKVLAELPARITAEGILKGKYQMAQAGRLEQNDYLEILNAIWKAKRGSDFELPQGNFLQDIRKEATKKLGIDNLEANVFVEYFTGPNASYAVAWSTRENGQQEWGPLWQIKGLNNGDEVVGNALREVLSRNSEEVGLGIVIGVDEKLPGGFATNSFKPIKTKVYNASATDKEEVEFKSLEDIRQKSGRRLANYILAPTLIELKANPGIRVGDVEKNWKEKANARDKVTQWRDSVTKGR